MHVIQFQVNNDSVNIPGPIILNINSCLHQCKIPDIFKFAEVIPLHKKGSTLELNN